MTFVVRLFGTSVKKAVVSVLVAQRYRCITGQFSGKDTHHNVKADKQHAPTVLFELIFIKMVCKFNTKSGSDSFCFKPCSVTDFKEKSVQFKTNHHQKVSTSLVYSVSTHTRYINY